MATLLAELADISPLLQVVSGGPVRLPGVAATPLAADDPAGAYTDVVIVAPAFAATLTARRAGPADERARWDTVLSFDPVLAYAAANSVLTRIRRVPRPGRGQS